MKLNRFYLPKQYKLNEEILIEKDLFHKIATVLKLKLKNKITIFNGHNIEALCKIISFSKKNLLIKIIAIQKKSVESPIKIHLIQSIIKMKKMDLIIQKATELGSYSITPLISNRTIVKFSDEKTINTKMLHWKKIAIAACEQSTRNFIPIINKPLNLDTFLNMQAKQNKENLKLILNTKQEHQNKSLLQQFYNNETKINFKDICLFIGPEGGLQDEEIKLLKDFDFLDLNLGPRILRAETAAITAISIIQAIFGDIQ